MISALKGMKDIYDENSILYEKIINSCEKVAKNYNFTFINTPHLEYTKLFKRSVGESSDIVGKEMYEFKDKSDNEVCLRPEGTAGVVRSYIENKFDKNLTIKRWFYHGSMFRYERPQKGRLREFHQFGVECFGIDSIYEDASMIFMLCEIFNDLNIKYNIKINSLGCKECMKIFKEKLLNFLNDINDLCDDCKRRKELNPIRVLDCKNENCQNKLSNSPTLRENLCKSCEKDFEILINILKENNISFNIDDRLVRGLDYYTKTAFEFISDEIGAKSAIAGGGRYDRLIEYLGGKSGYGIGFALGIERIIEILKQKEIKKQNEGIYICTLDEKYIKDIFNIAIKLRKNHKVIINYESKKIAKHLSNADNLNANIFLCMGENEAKDNALFYKNLTTKEEKMIKISSLENEI